MNLLFILPEDPRRGGGGIATFYRHLLPALARRGHRILALVGNAFATAVSDGEWQGLVIRAIRPPPRPLAYGSMIELGQHLAYARAAYQQAAAGAGFDLVETTDWGLSFLPWLTEASPPTIVQLHGSLSQIASREGFGGPPVEPVLYQAIEDEILRLAAVLVCHSHSNREEWQDVLNRPVEFHPAPFDLGLAASPSHQENLGLVLGRIQSWKGPRVLCDALRTLDDRTLQVRWVGRDTVGSDGRSFADQLSVHYPDIWNRQLVAAGPETSENIPKLIGRARFGIVPSTWDVFNYAGLEMMAAGLPIICSRGAGLAQDICEGVNGFLHATNDARDLAAVLARVTHLPDEQLRQIGNAARETVRQQHEARAVAAERSRLYDSIIAANRPRRAAPRWLQGLPDPLGPAPTDRQHHSWLSRLPARDLLRHLVSRVWARARRT